MKEKLFLLCQIKVNEESIAIEINSYFKALRNQSMACFGGNKSGRFFNKIHFSHWTNWLSFQALLKNIAFWGMRSWWSCLWNYIFIIFGTMVQCIAKYKLKKMLTRLLRFFGICYSLSCWNTRQILIFGTIFLKKYIHNTFNFYQSTVIYIFHLIGFVYTTF